MSALEAQSCTRLMKSAMDDPSVAIFSLSSGHMERDRWPMGRSSHVFNWLYSRDSSGVNTARSGTVHSWEVKCLSASISTLTKAAASQGV